MTNDQEAPRPTGRARIEPPDISEKGGPRGGEPQRSDDRLFMQLLAFTGCRDVPAASAHLAAAGVPGVLYEDLNDPQGIAVLAVARAPGLFIDVVRGACSTGVFATYTLKPDFAMFGRTYALGYEPDLDEALIARPRRTVFNPDWPWAVWYPLRRNSAFARLPADQQGMILKEHGQIGMAFGAGDLAHDVRLACYGLDRDDNDFVIGLIGKELYPLSALVQAMRKTQQTALYLDRIGPFLIGRAVWRSE
jgi:Chlorite dismutase